MAVSTLSPGQVIDLRGRSPLEGVGESLGMLIAGLTMDKDDKIRKALLGDLPLSEKVAEAGWTLMEKARKIDPGVRDVREAAMLLNPQTGDAKVSPDEVLNRMFPGGGALSADAIHSAMATFPGMQRTIQEKLAAEGEVTPEQAGQVATGPARLALEREKALPYTEVADIEARIARGAGSTADFTILEARNKLEVLIEFRRLAPPEVQAKVEAYGLTNLLTEYELKAEAMQAITDRLDTASPFEREVIIAGMAGPMGQSYVNYLAGERQYDQSWDLATHQSNLALNRERALMDYQAGLKAAGDATEAAAAQVKFLWEARDRSRATADMIEEAVGKDQLDRLPTLLADLEYDAQSIFNIDPASAATVGARVNEIFNKNKIKDVHFDVQRLWDQAGPAAALIGEAETFMILAQRPSTGEAREIEDAAQAQLIAHHTDSTGRFDSVAYGIVQNYISKLRVDPAYFDKIRAGAATAAAIEIQNSDAPTLAQARARREAEIEKIKTEMLTGGLNVPIERSTQLYYLMLTNLFAGYGSRTPSPGQLK